MAMRGPKPHISTSVKMPIARSPYLQSVNRAVVEHEIGSKVVGLHGNSRYLEGLNVAKSTREKYGLEEAIKLDPSGRYEKEHIYEILPAASRHERLFLMANGVAKKLGKLYADPRLGPYMGKVIYGEAKGPPRALKPLLRTCIKELTTLEKHSWNAYDAEKNPEVKKNLARMHHNTSALLNTLDLVVMKGHRGYVTGKDLRVILGQTGGRKFRGLSPEISVNLLPSEKIPVTAGNLALLIDNLAENVEKASRPTPGARMKMAIDRTPKGLEIHVSNLGIVDPNAFRMQEDLYNRGVYSESGFRMKGTGIVDNLLKHYGGGANVWTEAAPENKSGASYYNIKCFIPLKAAA